MLEIGSCRYVWCHCFAWRNRCVWGRAAGAVFCGMRLPSAGSSAFASAIWRRLSEQRAQLVNAVLKIWPWQRRLCRGSCLPPSWAGRGSDSIVSGWDFYLPSKIWHSSEANQAFAIRHQQNIAQNVRSRSNVLQNGWLSLSNSWFFSTSSHDSFSNARRKS